MQFDKAYKSQFEGDKFNCMLRSLNIETQDSKFLKKISEAQNLKKKIHM